MRPPSLAELRRLAGLHGRLTRCGFAAERRLLGRLLFRLHFAGDLSGLRDECLGLVRA